MEESTTTKAAAALRFDAVARLRIITCEACGMIFAAPESLCLARAQQGEPISCPSTHANHLPDPTKTPGDLAATVQQLLVERVSLQQQVARLELHVQPTPSPTDPPTNADLKKRARLLAFTARLASGGGVICPVCANAIQSPRDLATHLYRRHRGQIATTKPHLQA
jgi:hypothetical protein